VNKIKINNITVSVDFVENTEFDYILGSFYQKTDRIVVLKSLNSDQKKMVLIHELTHAFVWCYGLYNSKITEESMCDFVACYSELIINYANKILAKEKNNEKN